MQVFEDIPALLQHGIGQGRFEVVFGKGTRIAAIAFVDSADHKVRPRPTFVRAAISKAAGAGFGKGQNIGECLWWRGHLGAVIGNQHLTAAVGQADRVLGGGRVYHRQVRHIRRGHREPQTRIDRSVQRRGFEFFKIINLRVGAGLQGSQGAGGNRGVFIGDATGDGDVKGIAGVGRFERRFDTVRPPV